MEVHLKAPARSGLLLLSCLALSSCGDHGPGGPEVEPGAPVFQFALGSSPDGAFGYPLSIATDSDGDIYVFDAQQSQFQKLDPGGGYILSFPQPSESPFYLVGPPPMVVQGSYLYAADAEYGRIYRFDLDGHLLSQWGEPGDGLFNQIAGMDADGEGNLYVVDANRRVQKFSATGEFLKSFGSRGTHPGELETPSALGVDPRGFVYVADTELARVEKYDLEGNFVGEWYTFTSNSNLPFPPGSLAVTASGDLLLRAGYLLQKRSPAGDLLNQALLDIPHAEDTYPYLAGMTIAPSGHVLIVDSELRLIHEISEGGEFLGSIGKSYGSGSGEFVSPIDMTVDELGRASILDIFGRIHRFSRDGTSLGTIDLSGLDLRPRGILAGSFGRLLLVEPYRGSLIEIATDGRRLGEIPFPDSSRLFGARSSGPDRLTVLSRFTIRSYTTDGVLVASFPITRDAEEDIYPEAFAPGPGFTCYVLLRRYADEAERDVVRRFSMDGGLIEEFYLPAEFSPYSGYLMDVDDRGHVLLLVQETGTLLELTSRGDIMARFDGWLPGEIERDYGAGLFLDRLGGFYVIDQRRDRVLKYQFSGGRP
jgi:sugar lactone lactonase YvrE